MYDNRRSLVQRLVFATMFMALGLVVAACAPAGAPAAAPAGGESAAAPAAAAGVVTIWLPFSDDAVIAHFEGQIQRFREERPDIQTEITFVPDDFYNKVLVAIAGGTPPDVVGGLGYYTIALLHRNRGLVPLEHLSDTDFLPDPLESNRFPDTNTSDRILRGIPWLRYACSPRYLNLAQPVGSQNPENAAELIRFLTREDQQKENFEGLSPIFGFPAWPIRRSANNALPGESACPELLAKVHRLYTLEREAVLDFINTRIGSLQAQIAGEPTAVFFLDDETRRIIEYGEEDSANLEKIKENIQAAAVPVVLTQGNTDGGYADSTMWRDNANRFAEDLDQPGSAIIGALFVVSEFEGIPSADYIVDCSTAGRSGNDLDCTITDAANTRVEVSSLGLTAQWEDTHGDVNYPFATYETSSPGRICFYIDSRKCCIGR